MEQSRTYDSLRIAKAYQRITEEARRLREESPGRYSVVGELPEKPKRGRPKKEQLTEGEQLTLF